MQLTGENTGDVCVTIRVSNDAGDDVLLGVARMHLNGNGAGAFWERDGGHDFGVPQLKIDAKWASMGRRNRCVHVSRIPGPGSASTPASASATAASDSGEGVSAANICVHVIQRVCDCGNAGLVGQPAQLCSLVVSSRETWNTRDSWIGWNHSWWWRRRRRRHWIGSTTGRKKKIATHEASAGVKKSAIGIFESVMCSIVFKGVADDAQNLLVGVGGGHHEREGVVQVGDTNSDLDVRTWRLRHRRG